MIYEVFERDLVGPELIAANLRCRLDRDRWLKIVEALEEEFNRRLRAARMKPTRFKAGDNPVARLLGKELVLLAWAVEDAEPSLVPQRHPELARPRAGGALVALHHDRRADGSPQQAQCRLAQGGALCAHREPGRRRHAAVHLRRTPAAGESCPDRVPASKVRLFEGLPKMPEAFAAGQGIWEET